jgi:hypothetical protein
LSADYGLGTLLHVLQKLSHLPAKKWRERRLGYVNLFAFDAAGSNDKNFKLNLI